jgi:hypothetical protein
MVFFLVILSILGFMASYFYKKLLFLIKNAQKWLKNAEKRLFLSFFVVLCFSSFVIW